MFLTDALLGGQFHDYGINLYKYYRLKHNFWFQISIKVNTMVINWLRVPIEERDLNGTINNPMCEVFPKGTRYHQSFFVFGVSPKVISYSKQAIQKLTSVIVILIS